MFPFRVRHNPEAQSVVMLDADGNLGIQAVHAVAENTSYAVTAISPYETNALRFSRCCRFVHLDKWDWNGPSSQLESYVGKGAGRILIPVTTSAMKWLVAHADTLKKEWKLPFLPPSQSLQIVFDKSLFADFLKSNCFPVISSCRLTDVLSGQYSPAYPFLLKPIVGCGGKGIVKVHTIQDLEKAAKDIANPGNYLVQAYVEGENLSYGVFCHKGEVTANIGYSCLFRHREYGPFKSIQLVDHTAAEELVKKLMKGLNWNGIANVDLRIDDSGNIYILEVNPRIFANMRNVIFSGINFGDIMCQSAQGVIRTPLASKQGSYFNPSGVLANYYQWLFGRGASYPVKWKHTTFPYIFWDPVCYSVILAQRFMNNGLSSLINVVFCISMKKRYSFKIKRKFPDGHSL